MTSLPDWDIPADFFPITPWESTPQDQEYWEDPDHGLKSLADCGFTVAAFVRPSLLPECEKLGLKAIVAYDRANKKWAGLSDDDITSYVKKMVDDSEASSAVLGYLLTDEPGASQFQALGKAVDAVRKLAPGKLAYINLYPDYATINNTSMSQLETDSYEEYLERYVTEVKPQFISYDNYRVQMSNDLKISTATVSYYRNLMAVRRVAQKHHLPFWNIVSGNRIRPYTPVPSPANLLFQAYTTLAAGGQGVTWFTYYQKGYAYAAVDKQGHKTQTWSYLKMVNEQLQVIGSHMRKLKNTGVYFTSPAPVADLPLLPGQLVESAQCEAPLMIGEFDGPDASKYIMVVNLSLEQSAKFQVTLMQQDAWPQQVSPADGSLVPLEQEVSLWLTAGQGALIKL
ncbi:MAG: hypothetical protein ACR2IE_11960 [Candidatus Sumerlaeaceae bacterium]